MKYIEIGEVYKLKSGEKCIVLGAGHEETLYPEYKFHKPRITYTIRREDGEIYEVYESALESEDAQ